jgi:hypothetical protein
VAVNLTRRQRRQAGERREVPAWVQSLVEEYCLPFLLPLPEHPYWGMNLQAELIQPMIPAGQMRPSDLNFDSATRLKVDEAPLCEWGCDRCLMMGTTTRIGRRSLAARDDQRSISGNP